MAILQPKKKAQRPSTPSLTEGEKTLLARAENMEGPRGAVGDILPRVNLQRLQDEQDPAYNQVKFDRKTGKATGPGKGPRAGEVDRRKVASALRVQLGSAGKSGFFA